jgi:hypothetical protein
MSAESKNCEASRQPLLANGYPNTPVARYWFNKLHMIAATQARNGRRTTEAMFSARFVPRLHKEGQLTLRESRRKAVGRV